MNVEPLTIPEVKLITPRVFGDARGFFFESFSASRYAEAGIKDPFVQDNVSRSERGVLRGLHLQHPKDQGKLVQVLEGAVFDVAVDVRQSSPTFGQWVGARLDAESHQQLWVPPGFAHGFLVLTDFALFAYKCTEVYAPEHELSVRWNDPAIGIEWPLNGDPKLSEKDAAAPTLNEAKSRLPA